MKLPELKRIMKEHMIKGRSHMNKPAIVTLLLEKGLISENVEDVGQVPKTRREFDSKYEFTRSIRKKPKKVEICDSKTSEVTEYSSIYKASRALCSSTSIIIKNNGKVWHGYDIRILEE
jgi:hypothetical protein